MNELKGLNIEDVVFIDIETVRSKDALLSGTPEFEAWEYKMGNRIKEGDVCLFNSYLDDAALYPEFSKIVCISVGRVRGGVVSVVTYDGEEKEMLEGFNRAMDLVARKKPKTRICGHSVIGFDIPFIFRRCIANGVVPNKLIDVSGLKPWEVSAIDTKVLWKGSGYYGASLVAVCLALGIDSPKSDIDGSEVSNVYYGEGSDGLERIVSYCERDVFSVVNVLRKFMFEDCFKSFKRVVREKVEDETLIMSISRKGYIDKDDEVKVIGVASDLDYKGKEVLIRTIKAALSVREGLMSEDLELKIIKS